MRRLSSLACAAACIAPAAAAPLPFGKSSLEIVANEIAWRVEAYKPRCFAAGPLVMVFHGSERKPELARDNAIPLAEAGCAVVAAPHFDPARFPRWAYHFAGVAAPVQDGGRRRYAARPPKERTGAMVLGLVEALRREEGRPGMPYRLIGHSAGAQFLGRFAAFHDTGAERIVLANPGSYVAPSAERRFPFGYGGIPADGDDIPRYLSAPIVLLLATDDTKRDGLDKSPGAERQGPTRLERGHAIFTMANDTAAAEGLAFRWAIVEVPGLGHGSRRLYARPEAAKALFGR